MTLVSSIITDAYREGNIIPLVSTPNANQITEALRRLNTIVLSTIGNEAGDDLIDFNIGGTYTEENCFTSWIPHNANLMFNLTSAREYNLDPYPNEGQRFGVNDVGSNLATYNVVINGNGRRIEDAAAVTLNADDTVRQWMYTRDNGWVRITDLADDDEMPFASEFDDYFIIMLAARLNPRYGQTLSPESQVALRRWKTQLNSRYQPSQQILPDLDSRGLASNRGFFGSHGSFYNDDFSKGRTY